MATTATSKRFSRLNSRESFLKSATERKLRSKKVIANKSSQKINIDVKNKKKLRTSANNNQTPIKSRLRPRQNKKNYCEDSKLLQQYLPSTQQDSVVIIEKLNLEDKKNRKVPVYKTMKSDKFSEDKSDIYDFKFDINDTKEKITKKKWKKRNINKGKGKITKKTTHKKVTIKSETSEVNKSPKLDTNLPVDIVQSDPLSESALELVVTESEKNNIAKRIETPTICTDTDIRTEESEREDIVKKVEFSKINTDIQMVKELTKEDIREIEIPKTDINIQTKGETNLSDKTFAEQIKKQDTRKPRIVSIENANNILITTSSPNNTEDFQPFRPKNIFDNKAMIKQYKSALNSSLLMKSLSPILKTANTLDFGSPWRPPTLSMFSQAKHFIQSTPNMNFEINKEDMELNKENVSMNKENIEMNKENKHRTDKERKKKILRKKRIISRKLQTNQGPEEAQVITANKPVAVPARVSLGEIKNLQEKHDINVDNKQITNQYVEVNKPLVEQKDKNLIDFLNFSDTFDILSETERQSNVGNDNPLFMDLEPSHFSKPPQHSYRRKRTVKFDFSEDSEEEKEKENVKPRTKKKKLTKSEKEHEKRINEWVKTVNDTFQEIEEYNLFIE